MADIELEIVEDSEDIELEIVEAKLKPEQSKRVIPGYSEQTVLPDPGMTLGSVTVEAIPEPTERLDITENGEYDVARIGMVDVDVPQGVFPEGTLDILENGTYDVERFASATVEVPPPEMPAEYPIGGSLAEGTATSYHVGDNVIRIRGYAFYGASIRSIELPDGLQEIGGNAFQGSAIESIEFPASTTTLGAYLFLRANSLKTIKFNQKNIAATANHCLYTTALRTLIFSDNVESLAFSTGPTVALPSTVTLMDFSQCRQIVSISSSELPHANGCVIRVPAALLDEWQNALYWRELPTDPTLDAYVIWEGV